MDVVMMQELESRGEEQQYLGTSDEANSEASR